MLDQNTDRMWYVIGAVIVGAALIFLMNNSFPSLFGTIGNTFQDKTEQTTEITDGIMPTVRPSGERVDVLVDATWITDHYISSGGTIISREGENRDDAYTKEYLAVPKASRVSLELRESVGKVDGRSRVIAYDADKKFIKTVMDGEDNLTLRTGEPYTVTADLPAGTAYLRASVLRGEMGHYSLYVHD